MEESKESREEDRATKSADEEDLEDHSADAAEAIARAFKEDHEKIKQMLPRPLESEDLEIAKRRLYVYMNVKRRKLQLRHDVLRLKFDHYRRLNDRVQLLIIVVGGILTLYETARAEFGTAIEALSGGWKGLVAMIAVVMASFITLAGSALKFKRYQERMQTMLTTLHLTLSTIERMKGLMENVRVAADHENLSKFYSTYVEEIFPMYASTTTEIKKTLRFTDVVEHTKSFQKLTFDLEDSERGFQRAMQAVRSGRRNVSFPDVTACKKRVVRCP